MGIGIWTSSRNQKQKHKLKMLSMLELKLSARFDFWLVVCQHFARLLLPYLMFLLRLRMLARSFDKALQVEARRVERTVQPAR